MSSEEKEVFLILKGWLKPINNNKRFYKPGSGIGSVFNSYSIDEAMDFEDRGVEPDVPIGW